MDVPPHIPCVVRCALNCVAVRRTMATPAPLPGVVCVTTLAVLYLCYSMRLCGWGLHESGTCPVLLQVKLAVLLITDCVSLMQQ